MIDEENGLSLWDATIIWIGTFICWMLPVLLAACMDPVDISEDECPTSASIQVEEVAQLELEVESEVSASFTQHPLAIEFMDVEECLEFDSYPSATSNKQRVLTKSEKDLLAATLYLECRGESIKCQRAVLSLIFNRYDTGNYDSLHDVVYSPNQFSVASEIQNVDLSLATDQYDVIEYVCKYGKTLPDHVIFFRAGKYHNWSDTEDYTFIDNTYFSGSKKLRKKLEEKY